MATTDIPGTPLFEPSHAHSRKGVPLAEAFFSGGERNLVAAPAEKMPRQRAK